MRERLVRFAAISTILSVLFTAKGFSQPELISRDFDAEIEAAIRKQGHGEIENIAAVVLETDGSFSVIKDPPASQYTALTPLLKGTSRSEGA